MSIPKVTALIFMKLHSERVPFKNIRDFNGKPLFHWILSSLEKSKYINKIIINTDSEEIAKDAKEHFDVTIHKRPDYLLNIMSNEANQILEYDINKTGDELFLQTHSTNPILSTITIDKAIKDFLSSEEHDSLMSVTPLHKRFYFKNGNPINHEPQAMVKTQNLEPILEENSCIYIFSRTGFMKNKSRIGDNPLIFQMDAAEALDIDEEIDFIIAESMIKYKLSQR